MVFATGASCSGADAVSKDIFFGYWSGTKTKQHKSDALTALDSLKRYLKNDPQRESFKVAKGSVIGYMWVGSMVQNSGLFLVMPCLLFMMKLPEMVFQICFILNMLILIQ